MTERENEIQREIMIYKNRETDNDIQRQRMKNKEK